MAVIQKPFFVIPLPLGTITTGNEKASNPALHLGILAQIGMTWRSTGNGSLYVRGDMGSAKAIEFVSMLSANALSGTTIRVRLGDTQAAVDGTASYDSGAQPFISPSISREDGLYHSHLELPSTQTRRWWRIDIAGHTGDFEASAVVMGKKITPSRFYDKGWGFGVDDLGDIDINRFGVVSEEMGVIFREVEFKLSWVTEAEYETQFRPMIEKLGKRGLVYCCFDPEPSAYRQSRTYFGWFKDPPFTQSALKPRYFSKEYKIRSMI